MNRFCAPLCLVVLLAGCTPPVQPPQQQNGPAELRAFSAAADFKQYMIDQYFGPETRPPLQVTIDSFLGKTRAPATMPSHYPGTVTPYDPVTISIGGFAGTDPQALRSTEIDTARLIGDHLFVLGDSGLSVLRAAPANQMAVVSRFETAATPIGLYPLDGNRLVLVTNSVDAYYSFTPSDSAWLPDHDPFFDVYILDVNDPAAPDLLARYSIQGGPIAARIVDGTRLVLLSATYPGGDPYEPPRDITYTATADLLPTYRLTEADGHQSVMPLVSWNSLLRPANPDGGAVLTISTIDLASPGTAPEAVGMVGYWDIAYATPASIYLTNAAWLANGTYRSDAELHRFDIAGQTARYTGSVRLPGRPHTFSEKDSLLRVAVTSLNGLTDGTVSVVLHLLVLDPTLQIVGEFNDFPADVQRTAIEYIGNYAAILSFDGQAYYSMLVDFADPRNPVPLGSAAPTPAPYVDYLHLLDATHVLAIGSLPISPDAASIYFTDFTLMMYDVPAAAGTPLGHSLTVGTGGTWSNALTYREEIFLSDGLLILPVDLYEGAIPGERGRQTFGGLYLYRIDPESGFTLLGRIETADPYAYTAWHRAIIRDGVVYAVTNVSVQAASLESPGQILSKVRLP